MTPAGSIGRLGFRRWYERQLYASHAWLVACLLCATAFFALVEALHLQDISLKTLPLLAAAGAAGVIVCYSLQRYVSMLLQAQHLSERSTCVRCGTYGRYRLIGATAHSMTVSCSTCASEWTIE